MTIRNRAATVALGALALLMVAGFPLVAQEPAPKGASDPPARKKQDSSRRVPAYFGQIGLTTEQRATIYGIQAKRQEKIDALEKQIATEKAEMLSESEAVLTDTQKKLLENLRRAASEPAPKPATTPKSAN